MHSNAFFIAIRLRILNVHSYSHPHTYNLVKYSGRDINCDDPRKEKSMQGRQQNRSPACYHVLQFDVFCSLRLPTKQLSNSGTRYYIKARTWISSFVITVPQIIYSLSQIFIGGYGSKVDDLPYYGPTEFKHDYYLTRYNFT